MNKNMITISYTSLTLAWVFLLANAAQNSLSVFHGCTTTKGLVQLIGVREFDFLDWFCLVIAENDEEFIYIFLMGKLCPDILLMSVMDLSEIALLKHCVL